MVVMKKILLAATIVVGLMSCGSESSEAESSADSTMVTDASQAPMGDTANQINSSAGNMTGDTSNQNANDSVKGTNPASRSTTPGNDSVKSKS